MTGTARAPRPNSSFGTNTTDIDPDFRSGDLILNIDTGGDAAGGGANYLHRRVRRQPRKIGSKYGIPWKAIWDANRDILHDPDKIYPGQELKIPS